MRKISSDQFGISWRFRSRKFGSARSANPISVRHKVISQPSPFENIPNEVLERIISFALKYIRLYDPIECHEENGGPRFLTQVMVFLQVSRQFRTVTQHARFWHDFLFAFEDLVIDSDKSHERSAHLCQVLFSDPHFRSCFESKEDWTFQSELVFHAVAILPFFKRSENYICTPEPGSSLL